MQEKIKNGMNLLYLITLLLNFKEIDMYQKKKLKKKPPKKKLKTTDTPTSVAKAKPIPFFTWLEEKITQLIGKPRVIRYFMGKKS